MADQRETLKRWMSIALVPACLLLAAGNCNSSSSEAVDKDEKPSATAAEKKEGDEAKKGAAAGDVLAVDAYPDFPLEVFDDKERAKIQRVTKAELCPCPEATSSLHECLQDRDDRCALAEQVMAMTGSMVKAAYSETDILDEVAKFVENSKKTHEFTTDDRPSKGKIGAPVEIVEFADFLCPHCREATKIVKALHEEYPDKVVVYFKTYPLSANPMSQIAAAAAAAAHRQGKFWQMHDLMFENQRSLSPEKIDALARQIGLNMKKFKADMESPEVATYVTDDRNEGDKAGLTGTPTFYINGRRFLGQTTAGELAAAVEAELQKETTPQK